MTKRIFEQEWTEQVSLVNGSVEKNVLFDFYGYLSNMRSDLKALKKNYEQKFDSLSKKPLKHYVDLFKKRCDQYFDVLIANHRKTGSIGEMKSFKGYRKDMLEKDGNHYKIKDKYYKVMKKLAESIFEIEDEIAPIVEKFWLEELTSVDDYDANKEYFLLAHADLKTVDSDKLPKEIREFNDSLQGLCFSAISDKKTRLFNDAQNYYQYYSNPKGLVGIIAKPKRDANAIVGISNTDMLSTEYVDDKCAFIKYFEHSNVNRCFARGNSKICCTGTKISPPSEIFNIDVDTINEIILDCKNIDVEAVFYVADAKGDVPERLEKYKAEQEKRFGKPLPVVEVKQRNKLCQINLDELYDMM